MLIPEGGDTRLNVSVLAGASVSVAEAYTLSNANSSMACGPGTVRSGALFTSFTVTVIVLVALRLGMPSSVTTVVSVNTPGPCASSGVKVTMPFVSIAACGGGANRTYVSTFAGMSESVAVLVTVNVVSSLIV